MMFSSSQGKLSVIGAYDGLALVDVKYQSWICMMV